MKQEKRFENKKEELDLSFDNISKLTFMSNLEEGSSEYEMEMMEMMAINKK